MPLAMLSRSAGKSWFAVEKFWQKTLSPAKETSENRNSAASEFPPPAGLGTVFGPDVDGA